MKQVKVVWLDTIGESGRLTLREALNLRPYKQVSLGFLLAKEKEFVTLAQTDSTDETGEGWADITCIPAVNIISITEVIDKKERR